MTYQQMVDIASRHDGALADELIRECVVRAYEDGVPLSAPHDRVVRASMRRMERGEILDDEAWRDFLARREREREWAAV